jgi:hypothetical protein
MSRMAGVQDGPGAGDARSPRASGLRGPWWGFPLLLGVSCVLLVIDSSTPGWGTLLTAFVLLLWIPLGLVWCARVVLRFAGRGRWRDVVVPPVVVLATLGVAASDVPLQVRFDLARGSLDELVDSLPPGDEYVEVDRWVGTYPIVAAARVPGGVVLKDGVGSGIVDSGGLARLPAGPTDDLEDVGFESPQWHDLGGGWWSFSASW